ncbi:MAG TPA: hypothetical protein VJ023_18610 [Pyrinomonadaceae bacterium]|nr:hypothetical protein [Pyrinomonadaceae bacterium]
MPASNQETEPKLELLYTLFCDDVRLEVGNKLSLMGVFQNIMVQQLPVSLIKFAVVNHWRGEGVHLSEVRILTPDKQHPIVVSQPTRFEIADGGFADNISFFVNVTFPTPGDYWVQTLIDSNLFEEQQLTVTDGRETKTAAFSEAVN